MRKRINKEILKINDDLDTGVQRKYSVSDEYLNHNDEISLDVLMWFEEYDHIANIEVILPKNYPWNKPIINVGQYDYLDLLRVDIDFLKLLGYKSNCMCCSSILCKSWVPMNKISQVLDEVYENLIFKKKVINLIHCIKIANKYLNNDIISILSVFL